MEQPQHSSDPAWHTRLLPAHVVAAAAHRPGWGADAHLETRHAAVLFADVTGFSALTERWARNGLADVERLAAHMHALFGAMERQILGRGGDIQQFGGDSLLALWLAQDAGELAEPVCAALEAADAIHAVAQRIAGECGVALHMRIGIAAGQVGLALLGGEGGQWRALALGPAIARACMATSLRRTRQIVCHAAAWGTIAQREQGRTRTIAEAGHADFVAADVRPAVAEPPPAAAMPVPVAAHASRLAVLLPQAVLAALEHGASGRHLELRQLHCAFILLSDPAQLDGAGEAELAQLQAAVHLVQRCVQRFGGLLARLGADDKGVSVLAVWGVPGHLHEDGAARALAAAAQSVAGLVAQGRGARAGVATGRGLAGFSGGRLRSEYTVDGPVTNLAAKLMQLGRGGVLCDEATRCGAGAGFVFRRAPSLRHGEGTFGDLFSCEAIDAHQLPGWLQRPPAGSGRVLAGREAVRAQLRALLEADAAGVRPPAVVLQGPAGIGKTCLLDEVVERCASSGVQVVCATADAIESQAPYHLWRPVVPLVMGLPARAAGAALAQRLTERAAGWGALADWLPVLNDMLPLGLAETAATRAASAHSRADGVQRVMQRLFLDAYGSATVLIAIEDMHWSDSRSLALILGLHAAMPNLRLIASTREAGGAGSAGWPEQCVRIALGPLQPQETQELIGMKVGARAVEPRLAGLVHDACGGNALFASELAGSLLEEGQIRVREGLAYLARSWLTLSDVAAVPASVEALILQRLDRLPAQERKVIRLLSVLGQEMPGSLPTEMLGAIGLDTARLPALSESLRLGLLRAAVAGGEGVAFAHAIVRDTVYQSVSFEERSRLHRIAALWIEGLDPDGTGWHSAALAHHWLRTGDPLRAFEAALEAGEVALLRYANLEAVRWLEQARGLIGNVSPEWARQRAHARCHRLLGHAHANLGDLRAAQRCLAQGFALPSRPYPHSPAGFWWGILREAGRLLLHRAAGARHVARPQPMGSDLVHGDAFAMIRLSEMAYFNWEAAAFLYAGLRGFNEAHACASPKDMALWKVGLAGIAGALGMPAAADRYVHQGFALAHHLADENVLARIATFAAVNGASFGHYARSLAYCEQALDHARRCSDSRRLEDALVCAGVIHYQLGRLGAAETAMRECVEHGTRRGDFQTLGWAYLGLGQNRLSLQEPVAAMEFFSLAAARMADQVSAINLHGNRALAYLMLGERAQAAAQARQCLAASRGLPTSFSVWVGLRHATQTLLVLWADEQEDAGAQAPELRRSVRLALHRLRVFARSFAMAQPLHLLGDAYRWHIEGQARKACASARRAADRAALLGMPVEEALACEALGQWARGEEATAAQRRAAAVRLRAGVVEAEWMSLRALPHGSAQLRAA